MKANSLVCVSVHFNVEIGGEYIWRRGMMRKRSLWYQMLRDFDRGVTLT